MKLNYFLLSIGLFFIQSNAQNFDWGGRFGGDGEDVVKSMHVDVQGNVYTTGYFTDTADFDITSGTYQLTAVGWYDVFVQKVDTQGNVLWVRQFGGDGFDIGSAITTDNAGNVLVTGVFEGSVNFNPEGCEMLLTSNGGQDIFAVKLSAAGEIVWAKSVGSEGYEEALAIDATATENPVLVGHFSETVDFDPGAGVFNQSSAGGNDTFILQLKDNGDFDSARRYGGTGIDIAMDLEISHNGDIYITGYFDETSDLDPNPDSEQLFTVSGTGFSGYVLHLGSAGEVQYAGITSGGNVQNNNLAIDPQGNVYVTGYFSETANFSHTPGATGHTFTSGEAYNGFVAKYNSSGMIEWARHLECSSTLFGFGIAVNSVGHVLSGGYFEGIANFGSAESPLSLIENSSSATEAFLHVLDNQGNFIDAYQFGGVDFIDTNTLGVDGLDNVYHAAHFQQTVDINPLPNAVQEVTADDFRDNYIIKFKPASLNIGGHQNDNFEIYPNPTKGIVHIANNAAVTGKDYVIFDMIGKKVASGQIQPSQVLDLTGFDSGVYLLKVGSSKAIKLVRE